MNEEKEKVKQDLEKALQGNKVASISQYMLVYLSAIVSLAGAAVAGDAGAAVGGIAGGIVASGAAHWSDEEKKRRERLFESYMKLQEDEIKEIGITLIEVMQRLDLMDDKIRERLESPEYLKLIKKCFRNWAAAESEEKRILIRNLLVNAASTRIAEDDVVSLFIKWVDVYSEGHFAVVREIYNNSGITRREVWDKIYAKNVREDSAEADLFKLYFHDLSTGRVIRQHKEKDEMGNFLKSPRAPRNYRSQYMTSAFDESKEYELTELGNQFVHYAMTDVPPKISSTAADNSDPV